MNSISRRDVLKGIGALGFSPLFGGVRPFLPADSFAFAFFSDTHFGLKSNFEENRLMMREMADLPFDFAVNGGDITDYGWVGEYVRYREAVKSLPFPVRCIPGNHDVRWSPLGPKAFLEGTRDPMFASFDHKGCHFVLLDSTVPLSHWGHFETEMLRWLQSDLEKVGRDAPVFLFTHHWVGRDHVQTDNEVALFRAIEPYNVKLIFNGHGHSDLLWTWDGLLNTMNKGLYQKSWQRVEVDRTEGLVRLSRRAPDSSALKVLASVPLKAPKEKHRIFGWSHAVASGWHARFDDGEWVEAQGTLRESSSYLPGGVHRVAYRSDEHTYTLGEELKISPAKAVHLVWEQGLTGGVMSHVRLLDGVLYVSTMDGSVSALETRKGGLRWRAKTRGYCHSSPLVLKDLVVVGSADGLVHAFDREGGHERWTTATGGPVYSSATEAGGCIAIASGDGTIMGLDPATGRKKWRYDLPKSNTAFVQSPLATDGTHVFAGAWDSHLYALDGSTGKLVWKQGCCADRSFAYSAAIGNPVVGQGKVVIPANGNVLYCFEAVTGEPCWQIKSPGDKFGYPSPCLEGDRIYVGGLGDKGEGRCVSLLTGEILWTASTGSVIYDSGACAVGKHVVFCSVSGLITAVKAADGEIIGRYQLPTGHLLSTPASDGRLVYVGSYSDKLFALEFREEA